MERLIFVMQTGKSQVQPVYTSRIELQNQRILYMSEELSKLLESDKRYKKAAYEFVLDCLKYANDVLEMGKTNTAAADHDEDDEPPLEAENHITPRELCRAVKVYAVNQYGLMAKATLNNWGIHSTEDIGQIVCSLVKCGALFADENDDIKQFDNLFDFDDAFDEQFTF